MLKPSGAGGVCLACKFDPDCIFEAASDRVALQCEQFELGLLESPGQAPTIHGNPFGRNPSCEKDWSAHSGLCANCDNRKTCIYPKPEGGVWRCEEYA